MRTQLHSVAKVALEAQFLGYAIVVGVEYFFIDFLPDLISDAPFIQGCGNMYAIQQVIAPGVIGEMHGGFQMPGLVFSAPPQYFGDFRSFLRAGFGYAYECAECIAVILEFLLQVFLKQAFRQELYGFGVMHFSQEISCRVASLMIFLAAGFR